MNVEIRKATASDLEAVARIYDHIHTEEEQGGSKLAGGEAFTL